MMLQLGTTTTTNNHALSDSLVLLRPINNQDWNLNNKAFWPTATHSGNDTEASSRARFNHGNDLGAADKDTLVKDTTQRKTMSALVHAEAFCLRVCLRR